jgi:integrase/recombinase XerD
MTVIITLFNEFLNAEKSFSASTVSSYLRDLQQFEAYYGSPLEAADQAALQGYIDILTRQGKSDATVMRCSASLRCFYNFLHEKGFITTNPARHLSVPKSERKIPHVLSDQEVELLLEQPICTDLKGFRDRAMLELLYASGMRVSELIALDISDINLRASYVRCVNKTKERFVPIYPAAVKAVSDYLRIARKQMIEHPDEIALFVNVNGERMSRQGFWKIVKFYQEKAGIVKEVTPHTLRHSFAAHLLENGADMHSIKEMMGHENISSTLVYASLMKSKLEEVYKKAHPKA